MTPEETRDAVEAVWSDLQSSLCALADALGTALQPWVDDTSEAASVGSEVKGLTDELADALSKLLPEIPAREKLDAFLYELASRRREQVFMEAANSTAEMLEFLRQISYGTLPNFREAPSAEDLSYTLEALLKELGVTT